MEIEEAVELIRPGLPDKLKSTWADLGCGSGVFTNALAALLGDGSMIYAVDKSNQSIPTRNSNVAIQFVQQDIEKDQLPFNNLDGILMANSLHYIKDKSKFIEKLIRHLKPDGKIILVEYDMDTANPWVPYPITFRKAELLFKAVGFINIKKIGERQSVYRKGTMYASLISDLRI